MNLGDQSAEAQREPVTSTHNPHPARCLKASENADLSCFSLEQAWLERTAAVPGIPARLCAPSAYLCQTPTEARRRQARAAAPGRCQCLLPGQVGLAKRVGGSRALCNHQETPAALSLSSLCLLQQSVKSQAVKSHSDPLRWF